LKTKFVLARPILSRFHRDCSWDAEIVLKKSLANINNKPNGLSNLMQPYLNESICSKKNIVILFPFPQCYNDL